MIVQLPYGGTARFSLRTLNDSFVAVDADSTPASGSLIITKNGAASAQVATLTKRSGATAIYDLVFSPLVANYSTGDVYEIIMPHEIGGDTYHAYALIYVVPFLSTNSSGHTIPQDGSLTTAKFGTGAIGNTVLATNAIGANQIATGAITDVKFAPGAITSSKFAAGAITATVIADGALTGPKIAADSLVGKGDWNVGKTGYSLSTAPPTADAIATAVTTAEAFASLATGVSGIAPAIIAHGGAGPWNANGTVVYVLPAAALQDLQPGGSRLVTYRGSRSAVTAFIVDAAGAAIDLTSKTLKLTLGIGVSAPPLQTVTDLVPGGEDGNALTFTPAAAVVQYERALLWSLFDVSDPQLPEYITGGPFEVRAALPPAA